MSLPHPTISAIEASEIARLDKTIPDFRPGDTVVTHLRIVEGTTERIQRFDGVCIARRNAGLRSSYTIRKISYGEGVERVFPLYSPRIDSIKVLKQGKVRRSKLYYLRDRRGKSARIAEKRRPAPKSATTESA